MVRQVVVRTVMGVSLLVVMSVLGVAVKVGRDTSQYLQTVSTQRDWRSAEELAGGATAVEGEAPAGLEGGVDGAVDAAGAVASR